MEKPNQIEKPSQDFQSQDASVSRTDAAAEFTERETIGLKQGKVKSKKKSFFKSPWFLMILMILGCCLIGFATVFPHGYADYPCFVNYNEELKCVQINDEWLGPRINENARIQVFLNVYDVRFAGGGCDYEFADYTQVEITTKALNVKLERVGNILKVNGNELAVGKKISHTNFWNPNPWLVYNIEFQNYGPAYICGKDQSPAIFVIGEYGNDLSPAKAGIVLIIASSITFLVLLIVRKQRQ